MERKKKHLDFVLQENAFRKLIFRFYPRLSSCHSFGNEPPKTWDDVYKVYHNYKILSIPKLEPHTAQVLWDSGCDECSAISEVAAGCRLLAQGITELNNEGTHIQLLDHAFLPFGDGVTWEIRKKGTFCVQMYNSREQGYRMFFAEEDLERFGQYLEDCCEYMLEHGDPI